MTRNLFLIGALFFCSGYSGTSPARLIRAVSEISSVALYSDHLENGMEYGSFILRDSMSSDLIHKYLSTKVDSITADGGVALNISYKNRMISKSEYKVIVESTVKANLAGHNKKGCEMSGRTPMEPPTQYRLAFKSGNSIETYDLLPLCINLDSSYVEGFVNILNLIRNLVR